MKLDDVKVICISFRVLPDLFTTGIPSICCQREEDVPNAIAMNKQYRIILICPAESIQQLYSSITSADVRQVFIFGYYTQPKVGDAYVKVINGKERPIRLAVVKAATVFVHEEEGQLRKSGDNQKANQLAAEKARLIELYESLYLQPF